MFSTLIGFFSRPYVESREWILLVHYGEITYRMNDRLKNVCSLLEPKGFSRVHRSFLVNMIHVRAIDRHKNTVQLASGESIPVSRQKMAEVAEAFLRRRAGMI